MPRLLAFVVCEKIIIDKNETPTLINVMQKAKAQLFGTPDTPIPADAMIPIHWAIFATWDFDAAETGRELQQKVGCIMPDQSVGLIKSDLLFVSKPGLNNNYVTVFGFPFGQQGTLKVKLWLETLDGELVYPEVHYPVIVEYDSNPSTQAQVTSPASNP